MMILRSVMRNCLIVNRISNYQINSYRCIVNHPLGRLPLVGSSTPNIFRIEGRTETKLLSTKIDNTANLAKDVIVFKYENPRFYRNFNIFAICQFVFWAYLSQLTFTTLRDVPVAADEKAKQDVAWWQKINLGGDRYRIGMTTFCFLIGYGILAGAWLYTLRSVRFLVLRKGGQDITLVTYGPFGKNRMMTVPLNCLSAKQSRTSAGGYLPLKVKNKMFFYILDMKGDFLNTKLFDYNVGLKRNL